MDIHILQRLRKVLSSFEPVPFYCEENIWKLVKQIVDSDIIPQEQMTIWLVTNPQRVVPICFQKTFKNGDWGLWDYHVVLNVDETKGKRWIIDPTSTLPSPIEISEYMQSSFLEPSILNGQLPILIRTVPASDYLHNFSSDRSHMTNRKETEPPWPCIGIGNQHATTLQQYWDCERIIPDAPWINYQDLYRFAT
jgi:hypothetical protein